MVYSRQQEQVAGWIWMILMGIVAITAVRQTVIAVGDLFRLGLSEATASILLLFAGIALVCLSNAIVALLLILRPSRSGRSPRWFLVTLGAGIAMIILGGVGILR